MVDYKSKTLRVDTTPEAKQVRIFKPIEKSLINIQKALLHIIKRTVNRQYACGKSISNCLAPEKPYNESQRVTVSRIVKKLITNGYIDEGNFCPKCRIFFSSSDVPEICPHCKCTLSDENIPNNHGEEQSHKYYKVTKKTFEEIDTLYRSLPRFSSKIKYYRTKGLKHHILNYVALIESSLNNSNWQVFKKKENVVRIILSFLKLISENIEYLKIFYPDFTSKDNLTFWDEFTENINNNEKISKKILNEVPNHLKVLKNCLSELNCLKEHEEL